jgi:hypothetical protein
LYKKNIELIKYVSTGVSGKKFVNDAVSSVYELLSHVKMLERKSDKLNELKNLTTQQLNIKNVFTVERVTLTCLAEKLRFLLYLDLSNDYKNDLVLKLDNKLSTNPILKSENNILNIFAKETSFERSLIEKLKNDLNNNKDLSSYFKLNIVEVNEYLTKSLFI